MKRILLFLIAITGIGFSQNSARMLSGVNYQTGTSYLYVSKDATRLVTFNSASPVNATLPSAANVGFGRGTLFSTSNIGVGAVTITCTGCLFFTNSSIGSATLTLTTGQGADIYSDGLNYSVQDGSATGGGGGGGTPGGANTQIQYNRFALFGGSPNFTFDDSTNVFSLSGTANISGPLTVTGALTNSAFGAGGPFCVQENNGVFSSTGVACGSGGGSIGPGTTNKLTYWTSTSTVGSSDITQNTGVSITTNDRIVAQNFINGQFTPPIPNTNNGFGILTTPPSFGVRGDILSGATTLASSGVLAGVYGTSNPSGNFSLTPYLVGVYGFAATSGNGNPSWISGIVGYSNTSGSGTVPESSGVAGVGAIGGLGGGGQNASILAGMDAQIQTQTVSSTAVKGAAFYAKSPSLTGAVTHLYGLYIEDQTVGGGLNTDPWGIFEAGSAKNQLGGSLTLAGIVGSTQCLHVNSVGLISGTGADCGTGGGGTFPSGTGFAFVNASSSWASAVASTGTGNVVLSSNAVLVTPNLGTPSALVLTNATGAPTWNQNTTGTSGGLTGCTQAAAGDVCYWNGSAWVVFTGNNSGTAVFQENASGVPSWGAGVAATYQVNGVALSSASTINFQNSAATNGITLTFTNSSAGIVKLGYTGTLTNAGLTNSATTVNGQTCTLGSTCTIPEQVNTVNMTSQAGFNLLTSTANSVGLTVTPVNSATNALKFEVTGGSYTGNAAGLFGTPSITVNGITATTYNGGTMSGTFPGNPVFSGSPAFNMTGGPFCVQETAGVLSSTGVACGSGGGSVGPGTVNGLAYFNASSTVASVVSTIEGQLVVFHHTGPPTAVSPSLTDNGSTPIVTSPYTVQCDSATTLLDRGATIRFTTGASVVTIPDSTGSGCSGLAAILQPITVSLTLNASGSDTFTVVGNGPAQTGLTTITLSDGQFASINQAAPTIWEIRITQGGSVTSVVIGSGLASTQSPLTTTGTMSIATGGVTNGMLAGNITMVKIAPVSPNSILGNWTGSSASPIANTVATCSANHDALQWTTNAGITCLTDVVQQGQTSTFTADQTLTGHLVVTSHDVAKPLTCTGAGSATAQTCTTTPTFVPATGDCVVFNPSLSNTTASFTLNVNGSAANSVAKWQTTTTLAANDFRANKPTLVCLDAANVWEASTIGNGPSGSGTVTVVSSGALTSTALVTGGGTTTLQTPSATSTLDASGNMSLPGTFAAAGAVTLSAAGVNDVPGVLISGAANTGGTGLQNRPQLSVNCATSTQPTWAANGTQIGVNTCTGWAGNFLDFRINGGAANSVFSVGAGGNITVASGTGIGSTITGNPRIVFNANSISANQPISIVQATNQIVTGTSTNLTTSNYPASSGAVTLTFPNVTTNILGGNSDTTTTDVLHATATGGIGSFSPLVVADLPTAIPIGNVGSAGLSATSPMAIASTGVISISADPTFNSLTCGTLNTTACIITGYGSTSGTATLTWPAVAGTTTNAITSSNRISAPAFTSTVSTGTAPFVVSSTTVVANLNASQIGGVAAANVVNATSPGVGIGHFAGSTQTLTSSLIVAADITSGTITGTQVNTNLKTRAIPFNFGAPEGSALSTNLIRYITVPYGCTITGYDISADSGTATIKFWKVATGTALPTVSNIISTSGVQLTTGTTVRSSTTSDFTTTTITAGDILAATNTATSAAKFLQAEIECTVP